VAFRAEQPVRDSADFQSALATGFDGGWRGLAAEEVDVNVIRPCRLRFDVTFQRRDRSSDINYQKVGETCAFAGILIKVELQVLDVNGGLWRKTGIWTCAGSIFQDQVIVRDQSTVHDLAWEPGVHHLESIDWV